MYMRGRHFLLIDTVLISLAYFMAFVIRFDLINYRDYYERFSLITLGVVALRLPVFVYFGLYRRLWRYASVRELVAIVIAVSVGSGLGLLIIVVLGLRGSDSPVFGFPRSIIVLEWLLTLTFVGGSRFAVRVVAEGRLPEVAGDKSESRLALIIGAGDAGVALAREMQTSSQVDLVPVGFVDDDPMKIGHEIRGLPVIGSRRTLPAIAAQTGARVAAIAMPTAPGKVIRETVELCRQAGLETRTIPGMYQLLDGRVSINSLRAVELEDLLRREPKTTNLDDVAGYLENRRVVVTGAGGSIGSELCRQIARYKPEKLVLIGHGENSIFDIYNELSSRFPALKVESVIADVRDRARMMAIFDRYRPGVVFHAAAHKHVPLMELNPVEAVTNNVFGTRNMLAASEAYGVERFVFVSTDKAVRPVNAMGATKRLAELLVLDAARRTGRTFVAVRFGNVLGSRGSVVPLFQKQIAAGGPVTVTHPDMKRFFMTIPEASQLILRAGALGKSGEMFVLDMGEQVRIVDLVNDLIRLSGYEAGRDIDVAFVGLRPGEKLEEELFFPEEKSDRTIDERIFVVRSGVGSPVDDYSEQMSRLEAATQRNDEPGVATALRQLTDELQQSESV